MSWTRRQPVGQKIQCEEILANGKQCRSFAIRATYEGLEEDEAQPRCRIHALSAAERSNMARRMAAASTAVRRGNTEVASKLSGLDPGFRFADVVPVLREALTATVPVLGTPDWPVRLAAVGALLSGWPSYLRTTPEACRELLQRALPPSIQDEVLLDAERAYEELRKQWDAVDGLRWSDLVGLWVARYPAFMIPSWIDSRKIQGRRPRPISPERAPVKRTPVGPVLERAGSFPLVLPEEEPLESDWPALEATEAVPY